MGRKRQTEELYVYMNGEKVGTLLYNSRQRGSAYQFTYSDEWLISPSSRPISLSLGLRKEAHVGDVVENYFENLLPDNIKVRRVIQQRVGAASDRSFDLLKKVGNECVGAIQLSVDDNPLDVKKIEAEPVSDEHIKEILLHCKVNPLGIDEDSDFRISLAGAQDKTALLRLNGKWCRPSGTTATSHILKPAIGVTGRYDLRQSVENEWLCHVIFKEFGLPVADAAMHSFEGVGALAVERFDRRWSSDGSWLIRLPQEDFCQVFGLSSANKYENLGGPGVAKIMDVLARSAEAQRDRRVFMRTLLLFWLLAAVDGHAKNFSLFLLPGGSYQLTPSYDVLSAHPLVATKQLAPSRVKMAMAVRGRNPHYYWERIRHRHWLSTAKLARFSVDGMSQIIDETLEQLDEIVARVSAQLPKEFPSTVAEPIFAGMKKSREMLVASKREKND